MSRIIIEIKNANQMRYETCGDWFISPNGDWVIQVANLNNDNYNFLVALHELIEMKLCLANGINPKEVDIFDMNFEREREQGLHSNQEPGFDSKSPYRREHTIAAGIELIIAAELNIDFNNYSSTIENLNFD